LRLRAYACEEHHEGGKPHPDLLPFGFAGPELDDNVGHGCFSLHIRYDSGLFQSEPSALI
jgi:hypothetical protein